MCVVGVEGSHLQKPSARVSLPYQSDWPVARTFAIECKVGVNMNRHIRLVVAIVTVTTGIVGGCTDRASDNTATPRYSREHVRASFKKFAEEAESLYIAYFKTDNPQKSTIHDHRDRKTWHIEFLEAEVIGILAFFEDDRYDAATTLVYDFNDGKWQLENAWGSDDKPRDLKSEFEICINPKEKEWLEFVLFPERHIKYPVSRFEDEDGR